MYESALPSAQRLNSNISSRILLMELLTRCRNVLTAQVVSLSELQGGEKSKIVVMYFTDPDSSSYWALTASCCDGGEAESGSTTMGLCLPPRFLARGSRRSLWLIRRERSFFVRETEEELDDDDMELCEMESGIVVGGGRSTGIGALS